MSAWPVLGATVIALFAGSVAAEDQEFTVAYRVTTQGLDVNQPAGARAMYLRLQHAAEVVCTHGMRVDLKPVADERACYEKALAKSIGSANLPLLTQVYLQTHTLRDAAALGIELPVQMATKWGRSSHVRGEAGRTDAQRHPSGDDEPLTAFQQSERKIP